MGRFFATYSMNVGFQYTVELMPTCLRGQGIAMVNMMSMVSQMASPYIVYSVRDVIICNMLRFVTTFSITTRAGCQ